MLDVNRCNEGWPKRCLRFLVSVALITTCVTVGGLPALADPLQQLAIDARRAWNAALRSENSTEQLNLLRDARDFLLQIVSEYPDSPLAAKLQANEAVAGLTIPELADRIEDLHQDLGPCIATPNRDCLLEMAVTQAEDIAEAEMGALALGAVASALARAGHTARAERYRDRSLEVAEASAKGGDVVDDVHEFSIWTDAYLGSFDKAFDEIAKIEEPLLISWSYYDIVAAQVDADLRADAVDTVEHLEAYAVARPDPAVKAQTIAMISISYAKLGMMDEAILKAYDALSIAGRIEDWSRSNVAFTLIAAALARSGEVDWAWRTANQEIADPSYRCVAHAYIAEALAEGGDLKGANAAIESAQIVCPPPPRSDGITEYGFVSLARALALTGDYAGAIETARRIGGSGLGRAWALAEVGLLMPS